MASEEIERRLVAILMADVAGYSRLIGMDDEGTLAQLNAHHAELIEPKIKEHRGRIVRTTGDGLLVLFVSAVDALRCAVEIQRTMTERNAPIPVDRRIEFRMGVNVGDIVEGATIHGDGINVAARLEALAEAGGICVSSRVQEDAQGSLVRLGIGFEDIGQHRLKNIQHTVRIYRVLLDDAKIKANSSVPIAAPPATSSGGPEHSASVQEITVLVADMEGFRGLPERLGVNTVPFMSEYFDLLSHQIHAHSGTIYKFVGDTLIAFWNASEHAANACRAAVACQRALQKTIYAGGNTFKVRIGINSGTAVVGTVGPSTQRSFTIMGETLNVVVALERASMRYGTKIIIGEETWRLASKQIHVRELDGLLVQGRTAELQIYELLGLVEDAWERPNWLSLYEAGLEAYRARNFSAAIDSFRTLLTIKESDKPSQVILERCNLLLKAQPKGDDDTVATNTPRRHLTLPDKPSIAVLPFANLSSDPEQEYLVDGFVEDIITELSRFSELFVIARNSSFQYKGKPIDVRQVGRELGVRYVLEGSGRRGRDLIRISAQLIDAATGAHRWAERYDRAPEGIFAVQDEVVRTIVAILAAQVSKAETERMRAKPPNSWQAYDYYLQAMDAFRSFNKSFERDDLYEVRRRLQRSLAIDPNHAPSYAAMASTYNVGWLSRLDGDFLRPRALDHAHELARKAVELDPNWPSAHACLGFVLMSKGEHDVSISAFERARELNPNFVHWYFGAALIRAGDSLRALEVIKAYMRLDPFHGPLPLGILGFAHYMLKQYAEALPLLHECVSRSPNFLRGHVGLAVTYAQTGQHEKARAAVAELMRVEPNFTISGVARPTTVFKDPEDDKHYLDGLRKAGLPE